MKKIPLTPLVILTALFTIIGVSVHMADEAELRRREELQRQQEEYAANYEEARSAILAQDYDTAVNLLEALPEDFQDTEYVLVYAKYCQSVAENEDIWEQYRITWNLPHEEDNYTGDFAEEMQTARATAAREYEAEEDRKKREEEKKEREKIRQDQPYRGMKEKYIASTIWGAYDKKESENYRDSDGQVKIQNTYKWKGSNGAFKNAAVCRDGKVTDLIRYVSSSSNYSSSSGSSTRRRSSSGGSSSSRKDDYDVYDYDDPEDFYYDHEDDFDDFGDAEDYWDEAQ